MAAQMYGTAPPRVGATTEVKTMPAGIGYGNKKKKHSLKQIRFMAGLAHGMKPRKKGAPSRAVAKEWLSHKEGTGLISRAMKARR